MTINYEKLTEPSAQIAEVLTRWENDPELVPFIRPCMSQADLERKKIVTPDDLAARMLRQTIYLVYSESQLIGELSYEADPSYLYKQEKGTAWIGIVLGAEIGRGKGIGSLAMQYLEDQVRFAGHKRIELGVFEFNARAIGLYRKLGYVEIGRIQAFTFWQGRMWQDIRMEKYL